VVVCPKCRRARGAPEGARTARCTGCGRSLTLRKLRKYSRTDSLSELAEAVGRMNARLRGGLESYLKELAESGRPGREGESGGPGGSGRKRRVPAGRANRVGEVAEGGGMGDGVLRAPTDVLDAATSTKEPARSAGSGRGRGPRLERRIIEHLSRAGPSTAGELARALFDGASLEEIEACLERLRQSGVVYEPSHKKFALVR